MPPVHHFQLPRRQSSARKRKRARSSVVADDDLIDVDIEEANQSYQTAEAAGITSLTANQAEQYRVSGLHPGEELPTNPFPHAPTTFKVKPRGRPALTTTPAPRKAEGPASLRQNHLSVLTAIMHRCLLEGDYDRAGRAWGMLLRSGRAFDLRKDDRWGIGAEILMHRQSNERKGTDDKDSTDSDSDEGFQSQVTVEGLEAAKNYYESLVLQFPQLRQHALPRAATFYPALFTVWIFQVAEIKRRALESIQDAGPSVDESYLTRSSSPDRSSRNERHKRLEQLRIRDLREADAIAARLDALLLSPPYDKDDTLLHLRAMISLWLADLRLGRDHDFSVQDSSSLVSDASSPNISSIE